MQSPQQQIGNATERSAEALLLARGLRCVERNFKCRYGEIDLIMLDGDYLVFVEVRLRSNVEFVSALESVDRRKQSKLIRSAQFFLQQHSIYARHFCRFDVIASAQADAPSAELMWIKDAFQA